jgi:TetR/AcrR family transcriptional regulator, transcriptional repressor for nem operon
MARPREFDVDEVLEGAMGVFWEKGFEGASFADIEATTGVKKASLFAAFGDKRQLFLKAIRRYQETSREACREKLSRGSPREALRAWFANAVGMSKGDCARRGCMQVNTIIELAPHDEAVAEAVREHAERFGDILADAVRRGQTSGEFRDDVDAGVLADYLTASLYGLAVVGKAALPADRVDAIGEMILSTLQK